MKTSYPGRWLSRGAIVFGLLAALIGGAQAPSFAGSGVALAGECPFTNTLCLFTGTNFTGERFAVTSLVSPGTCVSLVDHGWGDRAHSAINTHGSSAALFMNDDCVGGPYQVPGNSSIPDFGGFTPESAWVAR